MDPEIKLEEVYADEFMAEVLQPCTSVRQVPQYVLAEMRGSVQEQGIPAVATAAAGACQI